MQDVQGKGSETEQGRDPISGLLNRRRFLIETQAEPAQGKALLLLTLADAQTFNAILRALGHARAEAFVAAGARRMQTALGAGAPLYHVSLLSFVTVIPVCPVDTAPVAVHRLRDGFSEPLVCDDIPIDARVGIGLARMGAEAGGPAEDLRAALAAAQDSRKTPEGWAWYDPGTDAAHKRSFRLLTDIKAALALADQLHLVYQPKVSLETGAPQGVEALLRWTHPEFGPVSPGEFVPLVEATALLKPLTRWVIAEALRQLTLWDAAGLRLDMAINVSPKNLEEPDFDEYLLYLCAMAKIDRARIEIEVTEGVNASQGKAILDCLAKLRGHGFRIAIDDFGSGYSNMSYLTRLSAQTLKIDQSLVRGVTPDGPDGRLLAGVVKLGRDLGYKLVAEGIETEAERRMLEGWGCDFGQGYLFARPMSGEALLAWGLARQGPVQRSA